MCSLRLMGVRMVAIFTGSGLGFERGSFNQLGTRGVWGVAAQGRASEQVFVNGATGNLIVQNTDEFLVGRGPDSAINRTYNSLGLMDDDNGDNWLSGVSRQVLNASPTVNVAGATIERVGIDGAKLLYEYDATIGGYVNNQGSGAHDIIQLVGSDWTWTDGNSGLTETYAGPGGRISSVTDRDGNTVSYSYSGTNISRVTMADGNYTDLVWSGNNLASLVTTYTDPLGAPQTLTRTRYAYDGDDRLISVTVDLSPEDNSILDGKVYVTTYAYDGSSKRIASIGQTDGSLLQFTYDLSGRVASISELVSTGVYRTTTLTYVSGATTITNPGGHTTELGYDTEGRLVEIRAAAAVSGGNEQITRYGYDAAGNLLVVKIYDGQTNLTNDVVLSREDYAYDDNGNLIERYDNSGGVTRWTYGAGNEMLTQTLYAGRDADGPGGVDQPTGAMTTRYVYDAELHLRFIVSAEGRVTEYAYDLSASDAPGAVLNGAGMRTAEYHYTGQAFDLSGLDDTDALSLISLTDWVDAILDKAAIERTDYSYDFRGGLSSITRYDSATSAGLGDTDYAAKVFYIYDQAGKLLRRYIDSTTSEQGEKYLYDGLGRLISFTEFLDGNASAAVTTTTFLDSAAQTEVRLASGLIETTSYSAAGQVIGKVVTPVGGALPDSVEAFKYDTSGNLAIHVDPTGVRTYFLYDQQGRKVADIDQDGSMVEYRYDALGRNIVTIRYGTRLSDMQVAALADINGEPTSPALASTLPISTTDALWNWKVYDQQGQLAATIDDSGTMVRYEYDGAVRLIRIVEHLAQFNLSALNGFKASPPVTTPSLGSPSFDRVTRFFYDGDGMLIGRLAPVNNNSYLTRYIYDEAGRQVETIKSYWHSSNIENGSFDDVLVSTSSDIHSYQIFDGQGALRATIDGEGYLTRFDYDALGFVVRETRGQKLPMETEYTWETLPASAGSNRDITTYVRDSYGKLLVRTRALSAGTETTTYSYTALGQLYAETTSESLSPETRTLTRLYDGKGRLRATLSGEGSAALAALTFPGGTSETVIAVAREAVIAAYGTRYLYDVADRLIAKITPDGSGETGNRTSFYYDTDGQLRFEINALGEVAEYIYNAYGFLTDKIVYGTRIDAGDLAGLGGGLVNAAVTDAVSAIADIALDSREIITSHRADGTALSVTDALGGVRTSYINPFGELVAETFYDAEATPYRSTQHSYGPSGFLGSSDEVLDYGEYRHVRYLSYQRDTFGRISGRYWGALHLDSIYLYQKNDQLLGSLDPYFKSTSYEYDSRQNLIRFKDRTDNYTSYSYDLFNRTMTTTTAEGVVSSVTKNAYGQTIEIIDGAGRSVSYSYDKNGNLKTITDAAGTVTNSYDKADRLIETLDGRGTRTTYSYDATGRVLTRVEDEGSGRLNLTTTYAYDAKGQQIVVTDAAGTITEIGYDLKGQKTRIVQDAGADGLNLITDYVYRADGKVIAMVEAVGTAQERTTYYDYDNVGRLLATYIAQDDLYIGTQYTYDNRDNLVTASDANGNITRFVYDKNNRQILSLNAKLEVIETGYDAEGRVIWTRTYATRIDWGDAGELPMEVSATTVYGLLTPSSEDRIERTLYDRDGRKAWAIDAGGYATRFVHDGAGNIVQVIRYADPVATTNATTKADLDTNFGSVVSLPSDAAITLFAYDGANRLVSSTDAEGYTESYQLDANGNRTRVTNKLGGKIEYSYDALGRLTHEWLEIDLRRDDGTQSATSYYRNIYEYDELGRVTHHVEAYGLEEQRDTHFAYDAAGRLIAKTLPQIHVGDVETGSNVLTGGRVETMAYDARGNLIERIDAGGARTLYYYDVINRKVAEINAAGTYSAFTYDSNGNLLARRVYGTAVELPEIAGDAIDPPEGEYRETEYLYDQANRLQWTVVRGLLIGQYGTPYIDDVWTGYIYDAFGNLTREIDANGNNSFHYYDTNGREIAKLDREQFLTTWTRDADGNVVSETRHANRVEDWVSEATLLASLLTEVGESDDDRITTFTYDRNGRRTSETRLNVLAASVDGSGILSTPALTSVTIVYEYNGLGQIVSKTEANGDIVDYIYDDQGRLSARLEAGHLDQDDESVQLRTAYHYDGLGNIVVERQSDEISSSSAITTRYHYGAGGLLRWREAADGIRTYYFYDIKGRMVGTLVDHTRSDGTALGTRHEFAYDILNRVVEERLYDYDAVRGWDWGVPTGRAFNAYGDVVSTSIDGTIQEQFDYDLAGRVVKTNSGDGVWKFFVYDKLGQTSIMIASAGYDLASADVETAISLISELDVNATYTIYDKRGLAIQTIEEDRDTDGLRTLYNGAIYNAFGEIFSESNAERRTTEYRYNTMGRLIERQLPDVRIVLEDGSEDYARTTDSYYYDVSGRLIGSRDANGNLTTRQLLAGTGHEGSDALTTREFYADGGSVTTAFDVHRNARLITDQIGRVTEQQFDAMGRVTEVALASGLVNHYAYDGLGQRTKAWNSVLGATEAETTDYDAMGRVIASRTAGGDVTTNTYVWDELLTTTGFGAYGGWVQTTSTDADRASSGDAIYAAVRSSDAFGHVITRIDKGGQAYIFEYDVAGRLVTENSTLNSVDLRYTNYTYYNTGKISQVISGEAPTETGNWTRKVAGYEFNVLGLLSREYVAIETGLYVPEHWIPVEGPSGPPYRMEPPEEGDEENWTYVEASYSFARNYIQDGYAFYDEHDRIIQYQDGDYAPDETPPAASKHWLYDAVGNVRAIITDYRPMLGGGTLSGATTDQIFWYRYDSMNRVVTTKGTFVGEAGSGHIERGTEGTDLSYNAAGQRMTAQTGVGAQEVYTYNAADLVTNVAIGGITRATNSYDLMGRVTNAVEYNALSVLVYNRHDIVYDVRGLVLAEKTQTKQGSDWIYTHTVSSYSATGTGTVTPAISFAGEAGTATGSVLYYTETKYWKNGSSSPVYGTVGSYSTADLDYADTYMTHNYLWRDGAVQDTVQLVNRDGSSTSSYFYDRDGFLTSVSITGGARPRSLYYTNNLQGQVLARTETTGVATQTYMFGGKQMGVVSNDGTGNIDYVTSLADRTGIGGSGAFRSGAATGVTYADFDVNFDHLNGNRDQGGSSGYVVAAGDTLGSIASSVWGDANLWYKIAQANGLTGSETLIAGTMLSIPGSINNIHHNADTFRPYDPAEAIGNTSPNTPKPPKAKNKCGIFGQILMVVIAVAVTALTYGALAGPATGFLGAVGAGAVSGAAGSIASQGFGVATGIQDKFNWKGVGMAAISGAVGGGLGKLGSLAKAGSALDKGLSKVGNFLSSGGVAGDVMRGVLSSGLSQGVGAATGLQKGFSWTGVAAAGIMAGSMGAVSRSIANQASGNPWNSDGSVNQAYRGASLANSLISSAAGSLANAASRSAMQGTSFGDNLLAALPDIIGGTIGTLASSRLERAFATERAPVPDGTGAVSGKAVSSDAYAIDGSEIVVTGRIGRFNLSPYSPEMVLARAEARWAYLEEEHERKKFDEIVPLLEVGNPNSEINTAGMPVTEASRIAVESYGTIGGGVVGGASWSKALATVNFVDLDPWFEKNYKAYGGMDPERWAQAIIADSNYMQLERQFLPGIRGAASNGGGRRFTSEFYTKAAGTISEYLDGVNAAAAPGLAQIDREGKAMLAVMFSPLIAITAAGGGMLGWGGAALETNRTAQSLISAGVQRDTISPVGQIFGSDKPVMFTELAFGGYGLIRGGFGLVSTWRSGRAAESVPISGPRLLATEGNVGTYRDLIRAGTKGDNITPNHIPSANRMAREGVSKGDGNAINMEQPVPGVGGRHRATFTYGTQADINMSARDALAAGVWDARQIYRNDGLYTPQIRNGLQQLIRMNKTQHPTIFAKPGQ